MPAEPGQWSPFPLLKSHFLLGLQGAFRKAAGEEERSFCRQALGHITTQFTNCKCHRLVGTLAPTCYGAKCMCATSTLEPGLEPSSRGLGLLYFFQDQYGAKKVVT